MEQVEFQDIMNKDPFVVTKSLPGTSAQTAGNYGVFFNAPFPCEVLEVLESHETATGATATLQIEKLTGTTAPNSGTNLLETAFNLNASANTVRYGTLTTITLDLQLVRGDRLALKDSGTVSGTATGISVVLKMKPLGRGHYINVK